MCRILSMIPVFKTWICRNCGSLNTGKDSVCCECGYAKS